MKWPRRITLVRHGNSKFNEMKESQKRDPKYQRFVELFEREMAPEKFQHWIDSWPDYCVSKELLDMAKHLLRKYRLDFGNRDTPLTELGWQEAQNLGKLLKTKIPLPDVALVSPYLRTRQTLYGIILGWPELVNVRMETEPLVREIDTGISNLFGNWRIMETFFPEQRFLYLKEGEYDYRYPQGENNPDVERRSRDLSSKLIREFRGKEVLIVSHHMTILSFVSIQARWTPEQFMESNKRNPIKNCSYTIFECDAKAGKDGQGKLALKAFNQIV